MSFRWQSLLRSVPFCCAALVAAVTLHAGQSPGAAHPKGQYAGLDTLPDWGGVWVLERARPPAPGEPAREQPALKGEYLAGYQAWAKEVRENNGVVRRETSNCMPPGMPTMLGTAQYPVEFLFTPGRVTTHHEAWMQWRSIFTDGRGHPEDLEPGIFGHSIGRWDGEALLVETTGIKTITALGPGIKHSPALRIRERITLDPADRDRLVWQVTMEDAEALERPYTVTHRFRRQRDWTLMEFICAENDRNPVGDDGHTTFR